VGETGRSCQSSSRASAARVTRGVARDELGAALLRIPAKKRGEVEGTAAESEDLRVDGLPGDAAKGGDGGLRLGTGPARAFSGGEAEIEFAVGPGGELEAEGGEEAQCVEAGARGEEIRKQERLAGGEGEGAVEQDGVKAERRCFDSGQVGFGSAVPILERGLEVGLKEVDGAEEISSVGVGWIGAAKPAGSIPQALLAEGNGAEFEEEAVLRGGEAETRAEAKGGFVKAAEPGESDAVGIFQVGERGEAWAAESTTSCHLPCAKSSGICAGSRNEQRTNKARARRRGPRGVSSGWRGASENRRWSGAA
jgi:hypothetical protein